jgi:predicted metalloprotease
VKQVGGRELHSEDCQPVVVRVCDKIRKLGGSERSGVTRKNVELYVVTACVLQEGSECGPFIEYDELLCE